LTTHLYGLPDLDLHLITEGRHERLWDVLGAHPSDGSEGCAFAVWAPNAQRVFVDGDFTGWDLYGGVELYPQGPSGIWHGYAAHARVGQRYKYRLLCADGVWRLKADPLARATQCPPDTASVIYRSGYHWHDGDWMAHRPVDHHARPMSVYEVHLGSWRRGLSYVDMAAQLVDHVRALGFTHVELMPVMEHPYGPSWGYQVSGYFAPTARFGTPDDLRYLVDRLHRAGIGVLLDWVPAHFATDGFGLARFDGTHLYERPEAHPNWGTAVFDHGRREVRNFLIANALYWCAEFHADGLRVDAVAELPDDFLRDLTATVYRTHPGIVMIAEDSSGRYGLTTPVDRGGLGFGLAWDLGWAYDILAYVSEDPVHRRYHHGRLGHAVSHHAVLPLSHDETVRLPGDRWQRLAGLRGLLAYQWACPGKPLLFMGAELGAEYRWDEAWGLDWSALHDPGSGGIRRLLPDLNREYRHRRALWDSGHEVTAADPDANVHAFLRWGTDGSVLACVVNFAGIPHHRYGVRLPRDGTWREVLNTDSAEYGGSNTGNLGAVHASGGWAEITLGPYAAVWLVPD
jgi:1,4-alpha-glucan branching enzyme